MFSISKKPTVYKISANLENFLKIDFLPQGVEKSNFQKVLQAEILYSGGFGHGEHESEKFFDFDRWKLPLGGVYP